jgi:hypothetical protein
MRVRSNHEDASYVSEYLSFAEQSGHYFRRPHDGIPSHAIEGAAGWRGDDLDASEGWRTVFTSGEIAELESAIAAARRLGKPTGALSKDDFPIPSLAPRMARWRRELDTGSGVVLLSGLPVSSWSDEEAELFFWCFGLHLGRPGAQNPAGDLLGHVRDTGEREQDAFVRLYQTTSNIAFHCDAADVVGLLCRNKARSGGKSRIVSSLSVFNALQARRPDLARRLFEPILLDIRDAKEGDSLRYFGVPPCRFSAGRLRTFYHSDYFRSVERHPDVPDLTPIERELLTSYEEIANDDGFHFDMDLEPGDIQLLSNHSVLHARTDYDDWPEPPRKRHLLRLWLSLA